MVNTVDFHSFLLEFIKRSIQVWSVILWLVHWPLNTFIVYSLNSLSSLVHQTLKRTAEDPGFEKSLVEHECLSSNKIPNGYFSIEVKVTRSRLWCQWNGFISWVPTCAIQNKVSTFKVPKIWQNFKLILWYKILSFFATNRQTLTQRGQELHAHKFISRGTKSSL